MISLDQGKKLINLARHSIETTFTKKSIIMDGMEKEFSQKQGVFVTLNKQGELRGCIGFPEPTYPLYKAIVEAARSAAFNDPRFPPLSEDELEEIEIEVSVLTVPQLIKVGSPEEYPEKINIGEDGLIIKSDIAYGLLLPQVFVEYNASVEQALSMLCQKAGVEFDAWRNLRNQIYKFQAHIFSEHEGRVIEKEM